MRINFTRRATVRGDLLRLFAARSTSMAAPRTRKSSDFSAVSTRSKRRSVFCRRPRQLSAFCPISSSEPCCRRIASASSCSACCCGVMRVSSANSAFTASAVGCDTAALAFARSPARSAAQTAFRWATSKPARPESAAKTRKASPYQRRMPSVSGRESPL